ncbi:MAG: hypothetical protein H7Y18_03480 [Clostridiaceae bacterium]|nr:hypothetical protein [Clostridiaceae bacterium]
MRENKLLIILEKYMPFKNNTLEMIRHDYENTVDKFRNYKLISKFFRMNKKEEYTLDDGTWNDLDMDSVYAKLDRTYSSPGEEILYSMLRNPLIEEQELMRRDKLIGVFKSNEKLREKLQRIFYNLNF